MVQDKAKQTKKAATKKQAPPVAPAADEGRSAKPPPRRELKPRTPSVIEVRYRQECVPALMREFGYTNPMQVPKLTKIVVNTCLKEALQDVKILETAAAEVAAITGQRPVITRAKKSIANFKLRKGQAVGARVTLRRRMMYEFFNRFVNVALPRVRDFKGVSAGAFDGRGNYTIGLTEQIIFPEINFDKVTRVTGMNITFCTTARTDAEGRALLGSLGMPFRAAQPEAHKP